MYSEREIALWFHLMLFHAPPESILCALNTTATHAITYTNTKGGMGICQLLGSFFSEDVTVNIPSRCKGKQT